MPGRVCGGPPTVPRRTVSASPPAAGAGLRPPATGTAGPPSRHRRPRGGAAAPALAGTGRPSDEEGIVLVVRFDDRPDAPSVRLEELADNSRVRCAMEPLVEGPFARLLQTSRPNGVPAPHLTRTGVRGLR
ncbi:hypothetical protein J7E88_02055 [Streptomyces sp. ISL-10]|uniref:hypothetical protein n=1 Tax=Streptomyces sp. ISL-10 TaxID=2819172 RepID=UPI001BEC3F44|nr:hypothetical protein [Streptomyces sp. ISL-10]MBT2364143.1 hypothetical protein [Streptomyces sp. ISL-10]